MEEKDTMLKVAQKVKELQAMAKKKKNMLEYQEVLDCLRETELGKEQIEKIYKNCNRGSVSTRKRYKISTLKFCEFIEKRFAYRSLKM